MGLQRRDPSDDRAPSTRPVGETSAGAASGRAGQEAIPARRHVAEPAPPGVVEELECPPPGASVVRVEHQAGALAGQSSRTREPGTDLEAHQAMVPAPGHPGRRQHHPGIRRPPTGGTAAVRGQAPGQPQ